jgi:hypothetical protein
MTLGKMSIGGSENAACPMTAALRVGRQFMGESCYSEIIEARMGFWCGFLMRLALRLDRTERGTKNA